MRCLPLLALSFAACAPATAGPDATDSGVVLDPLDCDDCDRALFLLDAMDFAAATPRGLPGFDLDGLDADCGVPDGTAPDGTPGVDNQLGAVFSSLPSGVTDLLPGALEAAIAEGRLMILLEVVGQPDLLHDGRAALRLYEGDGEVLLGTDGRPLSGQTVGLLDADAPLGVAERAAIADGVLSTEPFETQLRLDFLGTDVQFGLVRAEALLSDDGHLGASLTLGGVLPLDEAMRLIGMLGGDDADVRDTLEALVDARTDPDGPCDGISMAIAGHAVPAFVFDE